ncbi:hypothetical protein I5G67_gp049 [Mycobacterium phage Aminay]|uniref:Uncharacterized protein n=1 Tax=Mycobacterium phage Aminay TaxID=2250291 RepID=A0A345KV35_9CAUD|nr:hypothetical protein I5G67_gp049 [Mycobacterium phage Aminay]AXH46887.1 hypothetical protein SEA_AMINAY_49 [Mycobacterium phage Aminay]
MPTNRLPQVPTLAEVIDAAIGERVAAHTGIDYNASPLSVVSTVAGFGFELGLDLAHEAELAGRRAALGALRPLHTAGLQAFDIASIALRPLDVWDQPSTIVKAGRRARTAALAPLLLAKVAGL